MLIFPSFSFFPLLVITLVLLSRCIKAPAQIPPPAPSSPFCNLFSAEYLSLVSKKEAAPSNITVRTDAVHGRNLTLFSFTLPTDVPFSASLTFTINYISPEDPQEPFPAHPVAFVLARSLPPDKAQSSMQSILQASVGCIPFVGCFSLEIPCNISSTPPQKDVQMQQVSIELDDDHEESLVKDEVSFSYLASIAELRVQVVHYGDGLKMKQTFSLSLLPDAILSSNESAALFVGYITSGEASIDDVILSIPSSSSGNDDDIHISKHITIMSWVVAGTLVMGSLLGLIILVLSIMKARKRPQMQVVRQGSPPLPFPPPRRAPFSDHHDLESAPSTLPAPIHSNAFQISGTASWLKQPNPR